ncbi:endonuclease [Neorhizobium lilium]|uniref:Endonuclease n=1 Tax=Neorhizobium lilium TaxID=2503024 RepID=A0A3S3S7C0_9HYPH|nr:endonuclease/exonuclease/phosphatase family protein [Neorhizobium lilium]RWX78640.1 endonuclease [Neorhizobium lilium]
MRQTLSVAICVIVSLVLGALVTRYFHPHWILATLHSLQLHFAIACVVAMLVAVALHRHPLVYALLACAVILTAHTFYMTRDLAVSFTDTDAAAPTFRLMSFNILSDNFENADAIATAIIGSGADVVNVMEAAPLYNQLARLSETYPYRLGCGVIVLNDCDQLMLSKVPLENASVRTLSDIFENRFILAQVTLAGRRINIGGIHTTKPYFDNFHTLELIRAALAITDTDGPLILSGDFNASSLAPNMRAFLKWTDLHPASWEAATWPIEAGDFGVPIDHVYVRSPLKIKRLQRLSDALGSNHYGLMAEVAITGP